MMIKLGVLILFEFNVRYGFGAWSESKKAGYNLVDAVSRSTVQVKPYLIS